MKRIFNSLLISLVLVSLAGTAAATTDKTKHPKEKPASLEPQECSDEALLPIPGPRLKPERKTPAADGGDPVSTTPGPTPFGSPIELAMKRAEGKKFDLRSLPQTPPVRFERPERQEPQIPRSTLGVNLPPVMETPSIPPRNAPAPPAIMNFAGLDFANWGAGHPPDTNGDIGPTYYIQTINTSIGVFRKSDGVRVAAFTFNTFMSQGAFGNLCDTNNFGDPVVLYDSFEDRWIITDFAFQLSGNNIAFPPGNFQCVAASMSGDPVSGGWNFYSINTAGGLGDYPKFGIWPDGLYMSANMYDYSASGSFQNVRVYAFNKAQMYAGKPTVQVVTFDAPSADFTILPSNARLQSGTPSSGTPNYFLSTSEFTNALTVYKFHVNWNSIATSTFTGPDIPQAATSWPDASVPDAPSQGGNNLDVLEIRAMAQNQYTNLGGVESLWASHTVRRGNTSGFAAPRWYQVDVTGGTVNPNIPQAATWDPDGANVIYRFVPSVAVDRAGDMALGYSTSSSTTKPAVKYAGRLSTDPVNTLGQTESVLIQGTGTQLGGCGGPCTRWGDYSAMTLDPNGCTFWMTNEYYAADGLSFLTRIGSFAFPSCTPVGTGGTISGTVTATTGGAPIGGAMIQFGTRSTTTDNSGVFSFSNIPAGTYPTITASFPGFVTGTASSIVVTDGGTTTKNFSLATAPASACATDTTQADFQSGIPANVDLTTSAGNVILFKPSIDQQNTRFGDGIPAAISTTAYVGQTFTPSVTGLLTKVDIDLFCSLCSAVTQPNLTVSVRATSAGLPTGADIATATITGFSSSASQFYTGTFGAPPTLAAGTMYALVVHPFGNPTGSGAAYKLSASSTDVYAAGALVLSNDSGGTWGAQTRDIRFITYVDSGFAPSGNLTSSVKDAQPAVGTSPTWTTLSWTATTPANTSVRFQVAGSHSDSGPFTFIGPDGTAATFFTTSGASLTQFNGFRYIEYKAYLATTNSTVSPTLNDVTLCFADTACGSPAPTITPTPTQVCSASTGNTASGPAGMISYSWSITNGSMTGGGTSQTVTYTAGSSGSVGLQLVVTDNGGCVTSNTISIPINPIPPMPTITPGGSTTFCAGGSVTLTSSSASGNQWYLGGSPIGGATAQTYSATASGNYTVTVTTSGCTSVPSAITAVTVNPIPATPTITPGGPTTFCAGGGVTLTSSSATGNQWYLNGNPIGGATAQQYIATAGGNYTVTVTASGCTSGPSQFWQQGPKLVGTGAVPTAFQGYSVALSSDGNTAIVGGVFDNASVGAAWVWTRSGGVWSQQGTKLVGSGAVGSSTQGSSVALSSDGNTAIVGGQNDNGGIGAAWVWTRSGGVWTQQGNKLVGSGAVGNARQGQSVSLSSDGNTAIVGGQNDNGAAGAAWVWTRSAGVWTQQGNKLVGSGAVGNARQGQSVSLSSDGNTAIVGGPFDAAFATGAAWVWTRSAGVWTQQGNKLVGSVAVGNAQQGTSVSLSADGNTAMVGGATNNGVGAAWVWTRSAGVWTQQGTNLVGSGSVGQALQGQSVSLSGDGNTAIVGGSGDNSNAGAAWVWTRSGGVWTQQASKLIGSGSVGQTLHGQSVAVSGDGSTFIAGAPSDNSAAGAAWVFGYAPAVTVNPIPATPTIAPGGPTTFCAGGSVTLTSSSAAGNQWYLGGNPIGGATSQTFNATASGSYTVRVTALGCTSAASAATIVTVNPNPNANITVPANTTTGSTGNVASVANAGAGATYAWGITGGTITAGAGTNSITFTAGAVGTLTLNVTVTTSVSCTDAKSANVNVTPPVTVTSVAPTSGTIVGGSAVTINGTGFASGAAVTFGGVAATNIVVLSAIKITARTPAHAVGAVNVTVTNVNNATGTLPSGYLYRAQVFDPNGDGTINSADIFFLVNYLFLGGAAPHGPSGLLSGDANGDGVVNSADIFYTVNYLFLGGPKPNATPNAPRALAAARPRIGGSIALGKPLLRAGHTIVPVIMTASDNSIVPQSMALRAHLDADGAMGDVTVRKAGAARDAGVVFEFNRRLGNDLSYLVTYDPRGGGLVLGQTRSAVVAEIEIESADGNVSVNIDPTLTMLSDQAGTITATVANGNLVVKGTTIGGGALPRPHTPDHEVN